MTQKYSYSDNIEIAKGITKKERNKKKQYRRLGNPFWAQGVRVLILCLLIDSAVILYIKYIEGFPVSEGLRNWVIAARDFFHINSEEVSENQKVIFVKTNLPSPELKADHQLQVKPYLKSDRKPSSRKKPYT